MSQEQTDEVGEVDALENADAFSDENIHTVNAITLMRIYDMLGAILTALDEGAAEIILSAHSQGNIISPAPRLSGKFLYDDLT